MDKILKSALKHKERTVEDLVRFIKTHAGNASKYHLLLGAGCSITSGIRSAKELSELWLKELYLANSENQGIENYTSDKARDFFKNEDNGYWYNPNHEYSCLFEKRFDLPSQRRAFVEEEVGGKFPSIGYAYLIRLIERRYFNTIFTTNFDDLLNEAFHLFADRKFNDDERDLMRPIVCAHDSSVKCISVTSERPKIIKLHGDYLFDDIKSTEQETESLEENIRNKFVEFCKDFGLIVVGYSGNDRSVMDVINRLLKNDDYLKNGLYWCIRKEDDLSEELRKLLWKERVYFVYIDGFDELFAELYKEVSKDNYSPLLNSLPFKNELIMDRLVENPFLMDSKSPVIKSELERLKKEIKKNSFFNNMKEIMLPDEKNDNFQEFSFEETARLIEIDKLIDTRKYTDAFSKVSDYLLEKEITFEFKEQLLRNAARISKYLNKIDNAIHFCNQLIEMNPSKLNSYFFKNNILIGIEDKIKNMRDCLSNNKYCPECYEKISELEFQLLSKCYKKDERTTVQKDLLRDLEEGLMINPYMENECFQTKFSFLLTYRKSAHENWLDICKKDILGKAQQQSPEHPLCFYYQQKLTNVECQSDDIKKAKLEKLWKDLEPKVVSNFEKYSPTILSLLDDHLIVTQKRIDFLKEQFDNNSFRLHKSANFQRNLSRFYAIHYGDFIKAQEIISTIPDDKITINDLYTFRFYGEMLNDCSFAETTMQRVRNNFSIEKQYRIDHILAEMRKDFNSSLVAIDMMDKYQKCSYDHFTDRIYTLLEMKKYQEAYDRSNQMLKDITDPNDRQACDLINYEIARKLLEKNIRGNILESIIKSADNTRMKVAAYLLLGNKDEATNLIAKDILLNYDSVHYYKYTLVFQLFNNEAANNMLESAYQKIKRLKQE